MEFTTAHVETTKLFHFALILTINSKHRMITNMLLATPRSLKILSHLSLWLSLIKLYSYLFFFILTQWGLYNIIPLKREGIPISWSYYFKNSFINPIMAINRLSKSIINSSSSFLLPFLSFLGLPPA